MVVRSDSAIEGAPLNVEKRFDVRLDVTCQSNQIVIIEDNVNK